jgi:hypothetical protein
MHKTGNVLNKLPKPLRKPAKADIHDIWMAASRPAIENVIRADWQMMERVRLLPRRWTEQVFGHLSDPRNLLLKRIRATLFRLGGLTVEIPVNP